MSSKGLDTFPLDTFEIASDIDHADAYISSIISLTLSFFTNTLKAIGRAGAGVNNIPLNNCTNSGIVVFNSPVQMPMPLRS